MRQIIKTPILFLASIFMLAITSCTHNNGDIGDWFGTWRLESITIDGEADQAYAPPYMIWKFQNSIIQFILPDDKAHDYPTTTGSWHEEANCLYLDFSWNLGGPLTDTSHLPETCTLKILHLSGRSIELQYDSPDGQVYIYRLKKWG